MVKLPWVGVFVLTSVLLSATSQAASTTYTTESAFLAALPEPPTLVDFESSASGTVINSGDALGGITFTYSIGPPPVTMAVVSDFQTTSGSHYLGLDDPGNFNLFIAGDTFTLTFDNPVNAVGLYFVSGDLLFANDIELVTSAGLAFNGDVVDVTFGDGGLAYYIGLISEQSFSSVSIQFSPEAVETFLYSVDDIAFSYTSDIDFDNDGVFNNADNCTLIPNGPNTFPMGDPRIQRDTDSDGYGNVCDGDLDNSGGVVNFGDLALFKTAFGTSDPDADFDGSGGVVNFGDLAIFKQLFGQPPGPSGIVP